MPPKRKGKAGASAVPALKPEGSGRNKRTPVSVFDDAAGKDVYAVEKIVGYCKAFGVSKYNVKHSLFVSVNTDCWNFTLLSVRFLCIC